MNIYPINSAVAITVPFVDYNGSPVVPAMLSYTLYDQLGAVLTGPTSVAFTSGDTSTTIIIPGNLNTAAGPRVMELTIDTASAIYISEQVYALAPAPSQRLVFLQNSFQTHAQALFLARDMLNLDAWSAATPTLQQTAMIASFERLKLMNYVIPYPEIVDVQSIYAPEYYAEISPRMWPLMTAALYSRYPAVFTLALCKGQICEANAILTGDPIGDKIRSGLFSEKIGESSMMFRSGIGPLKTVVSRATLEYLQGFTNNRIMTTRS
jgi:hypothetical protein